MSKIVVIRLKTRTEIIGSDKRFKLETDDFKGSFTGILNKAAEDNKGIIAEELDNHNFIINSLGDGILPLAVHKSWVSDVTFVAQTVDDLIEAYKDDIPKAEE